MLCFLKEKSSVNAKLMELVVAIHQIEGIFLASGNLIVNGDKDIKQVLHTLSRSFLNHCWMVFKSHQEEWSFPTSTLPSFFLDEHNQGNIIWTLWWVLYYGHLNGSFYRCCFSIKSNEKLMFQIFYPLEIPWLH